MAALQVTPASPVALRPSARADGNGHDNGNGRVGADGHGNGSGAVAVADLVTRSEEPLWIRVRAGSGNGSAPGGASEPAST